MMLWVALLLACNGGDPELARRKASLDAWERGVALLEGGDASAARAAFQESRKARPSDALLLAWEARAAAEQGDLDAAIALLDEALAADPGFAEARYNRAAYHARNDEPEEAAEDLTDAIMAGVDRLPRDIREDPDFAPWLGHPAFAGVLPQEPLAVAVEVPEGSVFRGSEFAVRLRIAGAGGDAIGITPEVAAGPATLVEAIEETLQSTEGPFRDLTWRFRATGAGTIQLGPFHVYAGTRTVIAQGVTVEAKAPPGRENPDAPGLLHFATPREMVGSLQPPAARWSEAQGLVVVSSPGDLVTITPVPAEEAVRYEIRDQGAPKWVLHQYRGAGAGAQVRVARGGSVLFEGKPAR
jgi:hypothetical protein